MNTDYLASLRDVAQEAAQEAGRWLRAEWLAPHELRHKGFRDLVTDADLAVQKLITDHIGERFPAHAFLTEEEAELPEAGETIWVIDPIDGTSNFSRQQPNFSISIAAVVDDRVAAGVIYDPLRDELFAAARGLGSTLNGEALAVSEVNNLGEAIVGLDWGHSRAKRQASLDMLLAFAHEVHSIRAIGSAAMALAWVAAGRFDAYLNVSLQPWDVAAGALLIHEAGGRLSDWRGARWRPDEPSEACLASNGRLHQALLSLVATSG